MVCSIKYSTGVSKTHPTIKGQCIMWFNQCKCTPLIFCGIISILSIIVTSVANIPLCSRWKRPTIFITLRSIQARANLMSVCKTMLSVINLHDLGNYKWLKTGWLPSFPIKWVLFLFVPRLYLLMFWRWLLISLSYRYHALLPDDNNT